MQFNQWMRRTIGLLTLALLLTTAYAQSDSSLVGRIVEEGNGDPVAGVTVALRDHNRILVTDDAGHFSTTGLQAGSEVLTISGAGYATRVLEIRIHAGAPTDLGDITLQPTQLQDFQAYVGVVNDLEINDSGDTQAVSTSVILSNDVFLKNAGYQFSQFRHRTRGYDSRYEQRYINGVSFNEQVRGVFNYSSIGALNDLTRNGNRINYLGASDFSFGDIAGSENINMRPANYRRGAKLTLSGANRNYYLRGMASYNTGLLDNGWAFTALVGGRYAHEGVVEGTFYKNISYALGAEKQWDNGVHSLSFVTFGSPVERAQQGSSVQQAVELVGCTTYNPNWGWQNGKKRNARVVKSWDPTAILSYVWEPDRDTSWTTGIGVHYNRYGRSSLNWYNGMDPRPDYYRYLPNYFSGQPFMQEYYSYLWKTAQISQIDWDRLYNVNHLNNLTGNGSAVYMVEERRSDLLETALNSTYNTRLSDHIKLSAGVGYKYSRSMQFKTVDDLLGAKYLLDVDKFAERDFPGDQTTIQNDLNRPDRKVYKDDVFGYDYRYNLHNLEAWVQQEHSYHYVDFYYGSRIGLSTIQRDGLMRNGRYPDSSFGKGELHTFVTFDAKAGLTYKINGRHLLTTNASFTSRPPLAWDMYVSPDITDHVAPSLKASKNANIDFSYVFSTPKVNGRVSLFYSKFWDDMDKVAYYNDIQRTFVFHTLYDLEKVHRGIELGINWAPTSALNFDFIGTAAQYYYDNNPMGVMNSTNGNIVNQQERALMKDLYIGGVPQVIGTIGINYFIDYWFLSMNINGFGMNHIDPAPIRRLASNYVGVMPQEVIDKLPEGPGRETAQKQYDAFSSMTTQERFPGGCTVDLSIGKIIYLPGRQQINFNASVQNLLNKRDIRTGGYEQGRINLRYPENFGNKHFYMQGINFFINASYLF